MEDIMSKKIKLSLAATTLLVLPSAFAASGVSAASGSCWSKSETHHHCTGYIGAEARNWVGLHSGSDVYSIMQHDNAYLSYGVFGQVSRQLAWWNNGNNVDRWDRSYVFGSFYNLEVPVLFRPTEHMFAHVRLASSNHDGMPVSNVPAVSSTSDGVTTQGSGYTVYRGQTNTDYGVEVKHFSVGSELFDNFTVVSCAVCTTNDLIRTPSYVPDAQLPLFAAPLNGVVSNNGSVNNSAFYGIGAQYAMDDFAFMGNLLISKGIDRPDALLLSRSDNYTVPLQFVYSTDSMFATVVYSPNHVGAATLNQLTTGGMNGITSGAIDSTIGGALAWEADKWIHPLAGMFEYSMDDYFVGVSGTWTTGNSNLAVTQRTYGVQIHGGYHGLNVMDHPLELFVAGGIPLHVYEGDNKSASTPYFLGGAANWKMAKDLSMAVDISWLHTEQLDAVATANAVTHNFVNARLSVNFAYAGYVNEAPFFSKGAVMKGGPVGKGVHRK